MQASQMSIFICDIKMRGKNLQNMQFLKNTGEFLGDLELRLLDFNSALP